MVFLKFLFLFMLASKISTNQVEGSRTEQIVGGRVVFRSQFKYVVAIMFKLPGKSDMYTCTGSILNDFYISSIARCFYVKPFGGLINRYFYVNVGTNDLNEKNFWTRHIQVDTVTIPTTFRPDLPDTFYMPGNLAIVKVKESLELKRYMMHLSFLTIPEELKVLKPFYTTAAYGWNTVKINLEERNGKIELVPMGDFDGKMRMTRVNLSFINDCEAILGAKLAPGNMCGKAIRTDPEVPVGICLGDEGAPLVNRYSLAGIAINGFLECDEQYLPAIYINMTYYRTFILNILQDRKKDDGYTLQLQNRQGDEWVFQAI